MSTGKNCGAVYLDEGFDAAIRTQAGAATYDKLDNAAKAKIFEEDWEFGAKRKFNGTQSLTVYVRGYKPKRSGILMKKKNEIVTTGITLTSSV